MTTPRLRTRYQRLVLAGTAVLTAGATTAVGWLAGVSAQQAAETSAPEPVKQPDGASSAPSAVPAVPAAAARTTVRTGRPRVVWRERPHRTRVTVRYVTAPQYSFSGTGGGVSTPVAGGSAAPGPGRPRPSGGGPGPSSHGPTGPTTSHTSPPTTPTPVTSPDPVPSSGS